MQARLLVGGVLGSILIGACGSGPEASPSPAEHVEDVARSQSASTGRPLTRPLRQDGLLPGMARFRSGPPRQAATPTCTSPSLAFFGGPLVQSPKIVAVFWSSAVSSTLQASIGQFYSDVTASSYWSWLHEYDSVGLGTGSEQAILPGTFAGAFVITPQKCNPGGNSCRLADSDIQSELARQIGLGTLPAPSLDCTGNVETVYMVSFPPNISLTGPTGVGTSCVANGFCGYHNTATYGASAAPLIYAALMDVLTGPCAAGCGGSAAAMDNATTLASHELAEIVTDPDVGLDTQAVYASPAAWADNSNMCGEIADICGDGTAGDTIVVSGRTWVVQELWSNAQGKCTSTGAAPSVCSGTTLTNCRKCSCGDNGGACGGGKPFCETSSHNVLFGACEQCTATSGACAGGATCQQSSTPSRDDLCPCVPLAACPSGDTCGTWPDGCGGSLSCGTCNPGQTCDGGVCTLAPVDSGAVEGGTTPDASIAEAGAHDAGDAGGPNDASSSTGPRPGDSGSTGDAGASQRGQDPASPADASLSSDAPAATGDDAGPNEGNAASAGPGSRGGCGCRTVEGGAAGGSRALLGFGAVAWLLGGRRRRRSRDGLRPTPARPRSSRWSCHCRRC